MKKFSEALLILVVLISIAASSYIIYEQASAWMRYKDMVLGTTSDYLTKNARQVTIVAQNKDSNINKIADVIQNHTGKIEGKISIYYKNLTANELVSINSDQKYYMASLYKVILALYILDKVSNSQLTLDEKVGTSSATIEFALDKIITESNNEYANVLAEQYGWINIERAMKKKLGIEFSFAEDLAISIKNIGILFEEIALATRIPKSDSEYVLGLLGKQRLNSKLPKYLPSNAYSHNKTGEFDEYSHDAAIFFTPKANYILVFMSKTKEPFETNEQMALMSKEIYELLNGL